MHQRLDEVEHIVRTDQGTQPLRVNPSASEPPKSASGGLDPKVQRMIKKLEQNNVALRDIWLRALKQYRKKAPEETTLPEGFQERVIDELASDVYGKDQLLEVHGKQHLKDHAMEDCEWAQQTIVAPLAALDDIFIRDQIPNAINLDSVEYLAREALAGLKSTERVSKKEHWLRPRNAAAGWVSLVDWELYERINPRAKDHSLSKYKGMQEEIRQARTHDANIESVRERIAARSAANDRINQ